MTFIKQCVVCVVSADPVISDKVEYITAVHGQAVTFPCYSANAGVEWRWGDNKVLIYTSGKILPAHASEFTVITGGGWYNLTTIVTSTNSTQCYCFKEDGGPLIRHYRTTVVEGTCTSVYFYIYVSRVFAVYLCLFGSETDLISLLVLFLLLWFLLGQPLQKNIMLRCFKLDRDEIWQEFCLHKYASIESDFLFDITLSRWWP